MRKTLGLLLLLLPSLTSYAQWQQIKSPAGTIEVKALFGCNDKMFVMKPGSGLFTKAMSDTEWINCNGTYLIGVPVDGFFYGTDGSEQFFKIDLNHPENSPEVFFAYPPHQFLVSGPFLECVIKYCNGNLLVGSRFNGFSIIGLDGSEQTYNNGIAFSWPENSQEVNAVAFDEQYYYCNAENANTWGYAIYRCPKELNENWQLMNDGLPNNWATSQLECFDGRLFVAVGKQIYYSDDSAEHWDSLFTAPSDVTMLDQIDGMLYLGTKSHGFFQSLDNGMTWNYLGLLGQTVNKIMIQGDFFFVGTNNGVFVQQDEDWIADNYGVAVSCFTKMVILDHHIVGLESGSNRIFRLEDDRTYSDISPDIWMTHVSSMTTGDGMLFVSYYAYDSIIGNLNDYLIYSSDNGLSWNTIELPSIFPSPSLSSHSKSLLYHDAKLYVYENKKMAYTSDLGQTWTEVSLSYPYYSPRNFGSVITFRNQLFCCCGDQVDPVLMKLENNQWVRLAANGIPEGIKRLSRLGDNLVAFSANDGCYLSNDEGEYFALLGSNGYISDYTQKMAFSYQDRLFVSNRFANQCIESNHQVWRKFNGLSSKNTLGLVVLDDTLFLSLNNHGLWRMSVDDLQYEFIPNGSEWYYEITGDDGGVSYQHLEYLADTTINNDQTKVIVRTNQIYDKDGQIGVTHEYVKEQDNRIYWWNKELQTYTVLYDYGAETGDEWEISVGAESIVVHVDSVGIIDYQGDQLKVLHISDVGHVFDGDIVVGFGHLTSFFPEKLMVKDHYEVDGLRCYWVGDALLYHQGVVDCDYIYSVIHEIDETTLDDVRIYPNPTDGILHVETQRIASLPVATEYRITNLMGQTLLQGRIDNEIQQINIESLPAGMYFITLGKTTQKILVR